MEQRKGLDFAKQLIEEARITKSKFLDLGYCGLKDLNEVPELFELEWLEALNLGNNSFHLDGQQLLESRNAQIPNRINFISEHLFKKIRNLKEINLAGNNLHESAFSIVDSTYNSLESLNLYACGIGDEGVKQAIFKFPNLKYINLWGNNLSDKSMSVLSINLSFLRELEIGRNHITSNGVALFTKKNNILKSLYIRENKLDNKCIPFLQNHKHLEELNLSFNPISDISELEEMPNLNLLYLKSTRVTSIKSILNIPNLQRIQLQNCPIKDCPSDIYETNDINQIRAYFKSIETSTNSSSRNIVSIEDLIGVTDLEYQPEKDFNYEIPHSDINNFVDRKHNVIHKTNIESNPKKDVKLILLGNSNAGKSTLVHFLQTGEFLNERNSTHGMNVISWEPDAIRFPLLSDVTVNIWDFGGQEYYHEAYRLFLSGNAAYVILWCEETDKNCKIKTLINSKENQHLELAHFEKIYWFETVAHYTASNPNPAIIVTQCKTDISLKKRIPQDLHDKYKISDSFHISLKEGIDSNNKKAHIELNHFLTELEAQLYKSADKATYASEWLLIRKEIKNISLGETSFYNNIYNKKLACINITEFISASEKLIERKLNEDEKYAIPRWLNNTGAAVYFDGDLEDKLYPNPKALTDNIYKILNDEIRSNGGYFKSNQIGANNEIQSLMQRMGFIVETSAKNTNTEYIVPQYLPETHPIDDLYKIASNNAWSSSYWIKIPLFYYRRILHQLIIHYSKPENSENRYFWKHGILFSSENKRILIKGDEAPDGSNAGILQISVQNDDSTLMKKIVNVILEKISILTSNKSKPSSSSSSESTQFADFLEISHDGENYVKFQDQLNNFEKQNDTYTTSINGKLIPRKYFEPILNYSVRRTKKVFLSYAHKNSIWLDRLRVHLAGLKNSNLIETWTDKELLPGELWDEQIKRQIASGDVFILLLSSDFIASSYIWQEELPKIKTAMEKEDKNIVPILMEPFDLGAVNELNGYQILPKTTDNQLKAVSLWDNPELALAEIAQEIRSIIEK